MMLINMIKIEDIISNTTQVQNHVLPIFYRDLNTS